LAQHLRNPHTGLIIELDDLKEEPAPRLSPEIVANLGGEASRRFPHLWGVVLDFALRQSTSRFFIYPIQECLQTLRVFGAAPYGFTSGPDRSRRPPT